MRWCGGRAKGRPSWNSEIVHCLEQVVSVARSQRRGDSKKGRTAWRKRLKGEVVLHQMPASHFDGDPGAYDLSLCIGASFAIGTFQEMVAWLRRYIRTGGIIAIGDIYAHN